MRTTSRLFLLVSLLLVGSFHLLAQATASGNIVGVVTDATGAAVPNATVTATEKASNTQRTTTTNATGQYRFDLVSIGVYNISVQAAGFSTARTGDLELLVGTTITANLPVTAGGVSTTVEVTTGNQLVDTEKTDSSTAVTPEQITDLPLNGRDFANLAILAPGVKQVDSYDPTKNRYAVYAVNGSSGRNTNTTVNGIDNKDNTVGGAVMQLPLEAVQEFKISTNRFSAENGRSEGAALNVVTKAGTNQFHGSLYFFNRNQAYQTNDAISIAGGQPKPDFSRQQYGGSIGGYLRRDKDFGFFAYEGLRERSSITVTPASFDELTLAANAGLGAQPARTLPTPFDEKRYNGRIDHVFSEKSRAFLSYSAQDNKSNNDQSTQQNDLSEGNFTINDLILTNFSLNTILTPTLVNNFTAGFQYWNNLIDSTVRAPYILFPDGVSFGTNPNVPQKSSQHKFQFRDDLSYTHGKHTLRGGVDYLYEPQVGGFFENNPTTEFAFIDTAANLLDPTKYSNGFSTPGVVQETTGTSGDPSFDLSPKMLGFYFEDDWRASNRLLLNLGIRYDRDIDTYGIAKQANSRTHQYLNDAAATNIPTVPTAGVANQYGYGYTPSLNYIGGNYTGLPQNDNLDISPRVGFSYDISGNGRLVIRGGYGLYFGQTFENIPLFMIQQSNATVFANTFDVVCAGPGDPSCTGPDSIVPGTNILLSNYRYGIDPAPVTPPASAALAPGSTGRLMDPKFRNPYTQQINAGLQYALSTRSVVEVEYVQSRGLHEDKTVNINPKEYFNGSVRPFAAAVAAAGDPAFGRIADEASIGRSYYDGLNVSYRQSVYRHFSATVNYTFAKALAFEGNPAAFRNTATNPFLGQFRHADFGRAPNDERHHVTAAGTVTLPFRIEISPILSIGSARPFDIVESASDLWGVGSGRSNPHAAILTGDRESPQAYVNYSDAAAAAVSAGTVSSAGVFYQNCLSNGSCREVSYNSRSGQTFMQLDARVGKTISFHDRYNVNLFFQGFDLTNRANYGNNYDGNVDDAGSTFLQPLGYITPNGSVIPHSFTGEFGARFSF